MSSLLVAVPSRGRPDSIARLLNAMSETCRGDTTLVVGLDEDDPERGRYPVPPHPPGRWTVQVLPGLRRVVPWLNALAVPLTEFYDYIGHFGDDNVPRTVGWDLRVMDALGRTPFAFANDLYPGRGPGELACHVFTRSEVIAALGYFGPPTLRHMYVDNVWTHWGQQCGISFLPEVVIEHMHYTAGKSLLDQSYVESTSLMAADEAAYKAYFASPSGLVADIEKIRRVT